MCRNDIRCKFKHLFAQQKCSERIVFAQIERNKFNSFALKRLHHNIIMIQFFQGDDKNFVSFFLQFTAKVQHDAFCAADGYFRKYKYNSHNITTNKKAPEFDSGAFLFKALNYFWAFSQSALQTKAVRLRPSAVFALKA